MKERFKFDYHIQDFIEDVSNVSGSKPGTLAEIVLRNLKEAAMISSTLVPLPEYLRKLP